MPSSLRTAIVAQTTPWSGQYSDRGGAGTEGRRQAEGEFPAPSPNGRDASMRRRRSQADLAGVIARTSSNAVSGARPSQPGDGDAAQLRASLALRYHAAPRLRSRLRQCGPPFRLNEPGWFRKAQERIAQREVGEDAGVQDHERYARHSGLGVSACSYRPA